MAKSKNITFMTEGEQPGLFGQKYSSRDYSLGESWGKNQFNSSFPASLVAYMGSKCIDSVYICTEIVQPIWKTDRTLTDINFK